MTVAAALNSTGDQVFAAYCFTAGASFLAMITSRSSDVRTFLNTIVSNRQIGAAREHTITADRATTRLSGTTLPFGEAMWLVPIKGQYFGFFREGAGSARWNIQGQPMISVPLAGAFEAFSSAVSNTICR